MKAQDFSNALNEISDKYIIQAMKYKPIKRTILYRVLPTVAVFSIVISMSLLLSRYNSINRIENNASQTTEYEYDSNLETTKKYYDLAAPSLLKKNPKKLKQSVVKEIKESYYSTLTQVEENQMYDDDKISLKYLGTYNGYIVVKIDSQYNNDINKEIVKDTFIDKAGNFAPITLEYDNYAPICAWSKERGFINILNLYNNNELSYQEIFSIWYYLLTEE